MTTFDAINLEIMTICRCVRITPSNPNAPILGFTDHDCDLFIDGLLYKAKGTFEPTATEQSSNLTVDNIQLKAVFTDDSIDGDLVSRGLYDGAEMIISIVNWHDLPTSITDPAQVIILTKGELGQVSVTNIGYQIEARSIETKLNRSNAKLVQPFCPYKFGDSDCQFDLVGTGLTNIGATVTAVTARNEFTVTALPTVGLNYNFGIVEFTSGANTAIEREVLNVDTGTFVVKTFESFPTTINIGDTVVFTAGCNKVVNDTNNGCLFYNNVINFGGFPQGGNFMPGSDFLYSNPIDHA